MHVPPLCFDRRGCVLSATEVEKRLVRPTDSTAPTPIDAPENWLLSHVIASRVICDVLHVSVQMGSITNSELVGQYLAGHRVPS